MPASIQFNISEPCHENWDKMTHADQGRHCSACQKTVIDFSGMTDKEVLDYFKLAATDTCGRFTKDQLNKTIPLTEKKRSPFWLYTWNMVAAASLFTVNGRAQAKADTIHTNSRSSGMEVLRMGKVAAITVRSTPEQFLNGIIIDKQSGTPIAFASVSFKNGMFAVAADALGKFRVGKGRLTGSDTIIVSAVGYKTIEITFTDIKKKNKVYMEPQAQLMGEVSVVAYPTIACHSMVGGIRYIRKDTVASRVKREIRSFFELDNSIRIYPNPAARGYSVNIRLALKHPGKYRMEMFTADGKLIYIQPVVMNLKEQVISLDIAPSWSSGTYWIRISGNGDKVYQARLFVK